MSCLLLVSLESFNNIFSDPFQLSGATCDNGVCGCAEGYTYARGKCRKLAHLHSACSEV